MANKNAPCAENNFAPRVKQRFDPSFSLTPLSPPSATMQDSDYWELWRSIDKLFRVNIGVLISYARARRYFRDILSQLIDNIGLNNVTFGAYVKYAAKVTSKKDTHDKANS